MRKHSYDELQQKRTYDIHQVTQISLQICKVQRVFCGDSQGSNDSSGDS